MNKRGQQEQLSEKKSSQAFEFSMKGMKLLSAKKTLTQIWASHTAYADSQMPVFWEQRSERDNTAAKVHQAPRQVSFPSHLCGDR